MHRFGGLSKNPQLGFMVAYLPFGLMTIVLGAGAYSFVALARLLWRRDGWRRGVAVGLALLALLITLFLVAVVGYEIYDAAAYRRR